MTRGVDEWVGEWVSEWMSEWRNEWVSESMMRKKFCANWYLGHLQAWLPSSACLFRQLLEIFIMGKRYYCDFYSINETANYTATHSNVSWFTTSWSFTKKQNLHTRKEEKLHWVKPSVRHFHSYAPLLRLKQAVGCWTIKLDRQNNRLLH